VCACVFVGFVMCGKIMCVFTNVWVYVYVGLVICGCV